MFNAIITKIVGSKNERDLKKMVPLVQRINELEPDMKRLSDMQLAELTPKISPTVGGWSSARRSPP